jgi:hypothetical protein
MRSTSCDRGKICHQPCDQRKSRLYYILPIGSICWEIGWPRNATICVTPVDGVLPRLAKLSRSVARSPDVAGPRYASKMASVRSLWPDMVPIWIEFGGSRDLETEFFKAPKMGGLERRSQVCICFGITVAGIASTSHYIHSVGQVPD